MALGYTFLNIFKFIGFFAPFLLAFVLVFGTLFNSNIIKALVFLGGVLIFTALIILIGNLVKKGEVPMAAADNICRFTSLGYDDLYSFPVYSSALLAYITTYIMFPMFHRHEPNIGLVIFLLFLYFLNAGCRIWYKCNGKLDILASTIIGGLMGLVQYGLISLSDNPSQYLFLDDFTSNKESCSRPSNQVFKCAVYKNGQLIKNL